MIKKRIKTFIRSTLLIVSLFYPYFAYGAAELIIKQKSGEVFKIDFEKKPKFTFVDGYLRLESSDGIVDFPYSNLSKYTIIEKSTTEVNSIIKPECYYQIAQDKISFNNTSSRTVLFYNLQGHIIMIYNLDSLGNGEVDLKDLPKGILVVKVGNISFKFINRHQL